MAKGHPLTHHQQGVVRGYYERHDTITTQKLEELVSEIYLCTDPKRVGQLWQAAHRALRNAKADPLRAGRIIAERNVEALAKLIADLVGRAAGSAAGTAPSNPAPAPSAAQAPPSLPTPAPTPADHAPSAAPPHAAAPGVPSSDTLKSAMTAFKKRLKLTRLDQESHLSVRPMTSGKKSSVVGIIPPAQFPRSVWDELVTKGKLKYTGGGFYELVEP